MPRIPSPATHYHPAMFVAYEVLLYLVFILGMPFFLVAGLVRGKYLVNLRERMGFYGVPPAAHDLWIHAVSVGETLAAKTIVEAVERFRPGIRIVFTTTTITGQEQARRLFPNATVTYFPFDFSRSVNRFLDTFSPRVFATLETEIWPNVTRLAHLRGVRLLLANGRLSDRSYPRYRSFRWFVGPLVATYDRVLAREELDRQRFIGIGAPEARVETIGNVKFDFAPDQTPLPEAATIERLIAGRRVVVLGSTIEGEDELLAPHIASLAADLGIVTIVAPRRPERFEDVARLYASTGLRTMRRSQLSPDAAADVLVLDTLGELARIYRYASAAFIGGSLVPHGGHNPIEAAAAAVPVSFGPHMTNFREIANVLVRDGGAEQVGDADAVAGFLRRMLTHEAQRRVVGERGRTAVERNRGASERTAKEIDRLLGRNEGDCSASRGEERKGGTRETA